MICTECLKQNCLFCTDRSCTCRHDESGRDGLSVTATIRDPIVPFVMTHAPRYLPSLMFRNATEAQKRDAARDAIHWAKALYDEIQRFALDYNVDIR